MPRAASHSFNSILTSGATLTLVKLCRVICAVQQLQVTELPLQIQADELMICICLFHVLLQWRPSCMFSRVNHTSPVTFLAVNGPDPTWHKAP